MKVQATNSPRLEWYAASAFPTPLSYILLFFSSQGGESRYIFVFVPLSPL